MFFTSMNWQELAAQLHNAKLAYKANPTQANLDAYTKAYRELRYLQHFMPNS